MSLWSAVVVSPNTPSAVYNYTECPEVSIIVMVLDPPVANKRRSLMTDCMINGRLISGIWLTLAITWRLLSNGQVTLQAWPRTALQSRRPLRSLRAGRNS